MNEDIKATFDAVVDVFDQTRLRYAFVGALAAIEWSRSRSTSDLDLVVAVDDATWLAVDHALQRRGLTPAGEVRPSTADIAIYWSSGSPRVRVDVFIAKLEFEEAVLTRARPATVMGRPVRVASAEAVIVYKLLANRAKDVADVEQVFQARAEAGDALDWAFIDHWCAAWEISNRLVPWRAKWGPKA